MDRCWLWTNDLQRLDGLYGFVLCVVVGEEPPEDGDKRVVCRNFTDVGNSVGRTSNGEVKGE